jgi:hypothetical protein
MEDDDLLGGELGQEQDLRRQIQKGGRAPVESILLNQAAFKGRKLEVGNRDQERGGGGRSFNQGRWDPNRQQGYQGAGPTTTTNKVIGVTITKGGAGGIVNFSELGVNPFLIVKRVLWPKSNASDVWKMGTISLIATMNQCVISVSRKGIWLWIVDLARS